MAGLLEPRAGPGVYLGWIQFGALLLAEVLAIWAFPDAGELSSQLVRGELGSAALVEAERELRSLDADDGPLERSRALRRLGMAFGSLGKVERMLATLENACQLSPDWLTGKLTLADAYRALARPQSEIHVLLDAMELAARVEQLSPGDVRRMLLDFEFEPPARPPAWNDLKSSLRQALLPWRRRLARELDFAQRTDEAIAQYQELVRLDPAGLQDSLRLFQLLRQQGKTSEAERVLQEALSAAKPARGEEPLSRLYERAASPAARAWLMPKIRPDLHSRWWRPEPGSAGPETTAAARVLEGLRRALASQVVPDARLGLLEMEVRMRGGDPVARYRLAQAAEASGNLRAALEQYRKLRELAGREEVFQDQLLRLLRQLGEERDVAAELELVWRRRPGLETGLELARVFEALGRSEEALGIYRQLVSQHPNNPDVLWGLAAALRARGQQAEATGLLGRAFRASADTAAPKADARAAVSMRPRLLALYKGSEESSAARTRLHRFAELACDYHGLLLDYHDVEKDLPSQDEMSGYAGVITWFAGQAMYQPREFLQWLEHQAGQGRKLLMLGGLGALVDAASGQQVAPEFLTRALGPLGLRHGGFRSEGGPHLSVRGAPRRLIEAERRIERELPYFESVTSVDPANQVLLSISCATPATSIDADAAVLSARGVYVSPGYAGYTDPASGRQQLRLDLFQVLEKLFGAARPVPDPATVNGLRCAVIHVDGDGADNQTSVQGYSSCVEVLTDRIFSVFPLEASVSFVASEIDPSRPGTSDLRRSAEKLYSIPWIEPAAHAYSHIYDWRNPGVGGPEMTLSRGAFGGAAYSLEQELRGATQVVAKVAAPRTAQPLLLWSGLDNPDAEQLAFARKNGILAMNGGGGRCDKLYPSLTHLSPWTRPVDGEWQVLSPLAGDLELTDSGAEPLHAFRKLWQSWERGGSPRLKPAGLYFHHSIARSEEGLATLEWLYRAVQDGPFAVVPASEFIRQVEGFRSMSIRSAAAGRYTIQDAGRCLTVRCPVSLGVPDLSASDGVAGWLVEGDERYVHLVPARQQELVFGRGPGQAGLWLRSASARLASWQLGSRSLEAVFLGFGRTRVELEGPWVRREPSVLALGAAGEALQPKVERGQGDRMRIEVQSSGQLRLLVSLDRPSKG